MIFDRTFHPDEANQAFTVGRLLETGHYAYQPEDHHGPTLDYAAAPLPWAFGHDSTATLDGTLLRCTPLVFAVATLVCGFLALRKLLTFSGSARRLAPPVSSSGRWGEPSPASLNILKVPNGFNARKVLSVLCFVLLLATSPIFVFFATDFIQEMLLACFTMMMFWAGTGYLLPGCRWKPGTWALLFGIAAGLAFATKETSLLSFAAAFLAGWCVRPKGPHTQDDCQDRQARALSTTCVQAKGPHTQDDCQDRLARNRPGSAALQAAILAILGFLLTAILFYSSFCSNWQGVYNAFVAAPLAYIHRATGSAASTGAAWHVHPWWQYFKWLFAGNLAFATYVVAGLLLGTLVFLRKLELRVFLPACRKTAFVFTTVYAFILLALYAAIPYKTPWCALQMHIPLLLAATLGLLNFSEACYMNGFLSAYNSLNIFHMPRHNSLPLACHWIALTIFAALPCLLVGMLASSNLLVSQRMFLDPDSRSIPYNYAAASPEVKELAATVAAAMNPASSDVRHPSSDSNHISPPQTSQTSQTSQPSPSPFIAVALPPADTWPFPWYNRPYEPQTGYWTDFEALRKLAESGAKPTVVIVPMEEGHLVQPLFPHLKNTKRFYMRPGVRVRVFW